MGQVWREKSRAGVRLLGRGQKYVQNVIVSERQILSFKKTVFVVMMQMKTEGGIPSTAGIDNRV